MRWLIFTGRWSWYISIYLFASYWKKCTQISFFFHEYMNVLAPIEINLSILQSSDLKTERWFDTLNIQSSHAYYLLQTSHSPRAIQFIIFIVILATTNKKSTYIFHSTIILIWMNNNVDGVRTEYGNMDSNLLRRTFRTNWCIKKIKLIKWWAHVQIHNLNDVWHRPLTFQSYVALQQLNRSSKWMRPSRPQASIASKKE